MKKVFLTFVCMLALLFAFTPATILAQDLDDDDPEVQVDVDDDADDDVEVDFNEEGDMYARTSIGARAGFGIDPDQFAFGVQAIFNPLFEDEGSIFSSVQFAPSADFGLGDDLTTFLLNGDFRAILFTLPNSNMNFYGKVGPTIAFIKPDDLDSDTEVGLSLSAGMTMPMTSTNMYNLEARFGIGDIPDFRLLFGIQFGLARSGAGSPVSR